MPKERDPSLNRRKPPQGTRAAMPSGSLPASCSLTRGGSGHGSSAAGAYTRPLSCSTRAVSDIKNIINNPSYRLTPPKHPLNNP